MNDVIKGGMYRGENPVGRQISLDRRVTKVKDESGVYIDVPSLEYVRELEQLILALQASLGIIEGAHKQQDSLLRRLGAGFRKIDARLR